MNAPSKEFTINGKKPVYAYEIFSALSRGDLDGIINDVTSSELTKLDHTHLKPSIEEVRRRFGKTLGNLNEFINILSKYGLPSALSSELSNLRSEYLLTGRIKETEYRDTQGSKNYLKSIATGLHRDILAILNSESMGSNNILNIITDSKDNGVKKAAVLNLLLSYTKPLDVFEKLLEVSSKRTRVILINMFLSSTLNNGDMLLDFGQIGYLKYAILRGNTIMHKQYFDYTIYNDRLGYLYVLSTSQINKGGEFLDIDNNYQPLSMFNGQISYFELVGRQPPTDWSIVKAKINNVDGYAIIYRNDDGITFADIDGETFFHQIGYLNDGSGAGYIIGNKRLKKIFFNENFSVANLPLFGYPSADDYNTVDVNFSSQYEEPVQVH